MNERGERPVRNQFRHFHRLQTRWLDNDAYGHVNNVVYYSYFDTAVNALLVENGLLDPRSSSVVGLVAETGCRYFESIQFPDLIDVGLSVKRLGRSSVSYALGVFRPKENIAVAMGTFVHVYVDRATIKPTPIPDLIRAHLEALTSPDANTLN